MNDSSAWGKDVRTGTRLVNLSGLGATAAFLCGFGVWAFYAPLAGAAVVPGVVAAAGQNQRVQHLEGGIIEKIRVHEGERVEAGQILFDLDATTAKAQRDRLEKQLIAFSARSERLMAERDGRKSLAFPETVVTQAADNGVSDLLSEQEKEFLARLDRHQQETIILRERANALDEQMVGLRAQQTALDRQLEVVGEETARKLVLLDKGLTDRSEYTALLRSEAELTGQVGQIKSSILAAKTQVIQAKQELARLVTQRIETAASALNDLRTQMSDIDEQLRAANGVLDRIEVRAPSNGIVVKMAYNSLGSVVRPGDTLLELLPTGESLVIEARVSPKDIDVVSIGQTATLRFSALNARTTPTTTGTVTYVSADRFIDQATQQPYYVARIRIVDKLPPEITMDRIYPGMPVETYLNTGNRTFADYLVRPILDSFNRAFREE